MNTRFAVNSKGISLLAGTLILMAGCQQAYAANRLVPSQYPSIQAGINAAQNGDTILVADGTYRGAGNMNLSFKGKAITVRSASGDPTKCQIDGANGSGYCLSFNSGEGASSVLRGFTLTKATYGGISCVNSSPTIANCIISNNRSIADGGGLGCTNSSPTIANCTFKQNTAGDSGGAIFADGNSTPTVTDSTFIENTATNTGGAIANINTQTSYWKFAGTRLRNCAFYRNRAGYVGGAIFQYNIENDDSNCVFYGNSASSGGGVACGGGIFRFTNCVFSGNSASNAGSASYNSWSGGIMNNCTFTNNTSSSGSPVGVIAYLDAASVIINNCILFGNAGYPITPLSLLSGQHPNPPTVTYSNVQGGWTGIGNINSDPRFVANPSAGSDGIWNTADDNYGDLRLQKISPCIDAGTLDAGSVGDTDISGLPRVTNGTVDMGAHEFMNLAPVAQNDTYTFKVGALVYLDVLANDSDPNNDALTIISATHPGAFSLVVDSTRKRLVTRSFTTGTYTIRYTISDGIGGTSTATVTMVVIP